MLCFEGIALNLNIFRGRQPFPKFRLLDVASDKMHTITVAPECETVRPLVAGAILRDVTFDRATYNSFISLQDKLHQNLARQRTLVSIGTHDLDTIQGPFTYEALPPKEIKFAPLNQTAVMDAAELMEHLSKPESMHLHRYLPIIRDHDRYPVIYDANRVVCSLPPIINGNHSKITLDTKNILIEITATDPTKLDIVCNIMVAMFSGYCKDKFTIEPIRIVSAHNGASRVTPSLATRTVPVKTSYLNECCGLSESSEALAKLLERMGYEARAAGDFVDVDVPPTRADVLHACDIVGGCPMQPLVDLR
jgi:phenylalanyl-tRNA synthetase beta chain